MAEDVREYLSQKYKNAWHSASTLPPVEKLSTGIPGIDLAFGGGFPLGRISELSGKESLGKTSIVLNSFAHIIRSGYKCALIDAERTCDPAQLNRIGIDLDGLDIGQPLCGEQAIDMALDAIAHGAKLVVIDSVPCLIPEDVEKKTEEDSSYKGFAAVSGLISRLSLSIIKEVQIHNASLIFLNQVRDNLKSSFGGLDTPGGHALKHMCSVRLQLINSVVDKDRPGHITSQFKMIKSKVYKQGLLGEIDLVEGKVMKGMSLAGAAAKVGLIKKSGSWFYLGEDKCQGEAKMGQYLEENQEVYASLYKEVLVQSGIDTSLIVNLD